jgi:hypothetical protein
LYPLVVEGHGVDQLMRGGVAVPAFLTQAPVPFVREFRKPLFITAGGEIQVHLGVFGDGKVMAGVVVRFLRCWAV